MFSSCFESCKVNFVQGIKRYNRISIQPLGSCLSFAFCWDRWLMDPSLSVSRLLWKMANVCVYLIAHSNFKFGFIFSRVHNGHLWCFEVYVISKVGGWKDIQSAVGILSIFIIANEITVYILSRLNFSHIK